MKKYYYINYIKVVIMMLCSMIGVGFVSGSEIYEFFVRFKNYAIVGFVIFFILIFLLINKILNNHDYNNNKIKLNKNDKKYQNFTNLNKSGIKYLLLNINIIMIASAMFSGQFLIINKLFINNSYIVFIILCIIVFFVLYFGINGLQKFDYIVLLFLTFIIFFITYNLKSVDINSFNLNFKFEHNFKNFINSILFSIMYVFMNILQVQPILNASKIKLNKKGKNIFSIIFSVLITLILLIFILFLSANSQYQNYSMPLFEYFKSQNKVFYIIYSTGLMLALLSSLLSALVGVKSFILKFVKNNAISTFVAIFITLILSFIGFDNFITIVYPIIGIINFIIFVFL